MNLRFRLRIGDLPADKFAEFVSTAFGELGEHFGDGLVMEYRPQLALRDRYEAQTQQYARRYVARTAAYEVTLASNGEFLNIDVSGKGPIGKEADKVIKLDDEVETNISRILGTFGSAYSASSGSDLSMSLIQQTERFTVEKLFKISFSEASRLNRNLREEIEANEAGPSGMNDKSFEGHNYYTTLTLRNNGQEAKYKVIFPEDGECITVVFSSSSGVHVEDAAVSANIGQLVGRIEKERIKDHAKCGNFGGWSRVS